MAKKKNIKKKKKLSKTEKYPETIGRSTILDLDNDLKLAAKNKEFKESKDNQDKLREQIKTLAFKNTRINYERKKLKREQISRGTTGERVKQIDRILKGIEPIKVDYTLKAQKKYNVRKRSDLYLTIVPLNEMRNELNMISGKDFYLTIDNGLSKKEHIKLSTVLKKLKAGQSITEYYLVKMKNDIEKEYKRLSAAIEKGKKNATKRTLRSMRNQLKGLDKLRNVAEFNLQAYKTGEKDYEDMGDDVSEGEYPVMIHIVGSTIRINS